MALEQYGIRYFTGIHQGVSENALESGESPDACNMDTAGGNLSVAKGYVRESETPFPRPEEAQRVYVWNSGGGRRYLIATKTALYGLKEGATDWLLLHTFPGESAGAQSYDFLQAHIGSAEWLVVGNGHAQCVKWDGEAGTAVAFGSQAGLSHMPVCNLELYYNRLFAAGDPEHPGRLYWSQAPGEQRSIEDWSGAEESENVSGGHVEVGTDSDPITGLAALSNQLLIFKRDTLYRLLGDRPANYRILPVNAAMRQPAQTAIALYGDVPYFLTDGGMYYFDGQEVHRLRDADKVELLLKTADLTVCQGAACRDRLYFSIREHPGADAPDAILVYDLAQGTYMLRRGFTARALYARSGVLYLVDGEGYLCRFDEGEDYGGRWIDAYWETPMTDLGSKIAGKRLCELYLRGSGGLIRVEAQSAGGTCYYTHMMPEDPLHTLEAPLSGGGRAFRLRLSNVNGSRFTVEGGVDVLLDAQRRVL